MSKILRNVVFIMLLTPCLSVGMEPAPRASTVKIQTSDKAEFTIALDIAHQSQTLKNMIEGIGEKAAIIPLPHLSGQQFNLLLPAMKELAKLPMAEVQANEALAQQLQQLVGNLKSNGKKLTNQQLIGFMAGANFLDLPLVQPALRAFAKRTLSKDELQKFVGLQDKLNAHPAMQMVMLALQHPYILGVIENRDGNLTSWSHEKGTIKIWDINNLAAKPTTLQHPLVSGVIESRDGKNLISWSWKKNTIKIWDKNNLQAKPITLQHLVVIGVIESRDGKNLISWSWAENTIKIWDKNTPQAKPITLHHLKVDGVIESCDGKNLISRSWAEDTIKIWDNNNLTARPITLEHPGVSGFIESWDGKLLISWSREKGSIKIWDNNNLQADPITLQHPSVNKVIECRDGKSLISWCLEKGIIKIWDINNLKEEPIILLYPYVLGVRESTDGKNLISWSLTITILNKNNLQVEPITLQHPWVSDVIESTNGKNLISRSSIEGTIKIWDKALYNPTPELIQLLLTIYFVTKGQAFELTAQELAEFKATFNTLSSLIQHMLEKHAPDFVAALKAA